MTVEFYLKNQSIKCSSLILDSIEKTIIEQPMITMVMEMDQSARNPAIGLVMQIESVLSMDMVDSTVARLSEGVYLFM